MQDLRGVLHATADANYNRLIVALDHTLSDCKLPATNDQWRIQEEELNALQIRAQHMTTVSLARSLFQMAADLELSEVLNDSQARINELNGLRADLRQNVSKLLACPDSPVRRALSARIGRVAEEPSAAEAAGTPHNPPQQQPPLLPTLGSSFAVGFDVAPKQCDYPPYCQTNPFLFP